MRFRPLVPNFYVALNSTSQALLAQLLFFCRNTTLDRIAREAFFIFIFVDFSPSFFHAWTRRSVCHDHPWISYSVYPASPPTPRASLLGRWKKCGRTCIVSCRSCTQELFPYRYRNGAAQEPVKMCRVPFGAPLCFDLEYSLSQ